MNSSKDNNDLNVSLRRSNRTPVKPHSLEGFLSESVTKKCRKSLDNTINRNKDKINVQGKLNIQKSNKNLNKTSTKYSKSSKEQKFDFICSVCKSGFENKQIAENHILIEHYGLARINDFSNKEFESNEITQSYIKALKILPFLKCSKCEKCFKSGLGLKLHLEICGLKDNELKKKCEICGNYLKFRSMKSHMQTHKSQIETVHANIDKNIEFNENVDEKKQTEKNDKKRPIRGSAKKARYIIKSSIEDISGSDIEPKKKRKLNDEDLSISDLSSQDSDNFSIKNNIYQDTPKVNNNFINEKRNQLLDFLKDFIRFPEKLRVLSENDEENYKDKTQYKCLINKCNQFFSNYQAFALHYSKCGINIDYMCKLCDFKCDVYKNVICKHLQENHSSVIPKIPNHLLDALEEKPVKKDSLNYIKLSNGKFIDQTEKFHKLNFKNDQFMEWIPTKENFYLNSFINLKNYLPETDISPKFSFHKLHQIDKKTKENLKENKNWQTLNLFESIVNDNHITFYTGGPVYSGAWCPFPLTNEKSIQNQVLCISTSSKNSVFNVFDTNPELGLLQFWNFNQISYNMTNKDIKKPELSFVIAHNFGIIWEMMWCPGGTTFSKKIKSEDYDRLGLLALACSDGYVRILSIPTLEEVNNIKKIIKVDEKKIYNYVFECKPCVILEKHARSKSTFNKQTICKSINWNLVDSQRLIVSGYGNGIISVFDLKTNSSLLKYYNKEKILCLKPKKSWIGHGAVINTIKFLPLPGECFIISGGFDRFVKLWSLDDMITSLILMKKSVTTVIDWSPKYTGFFISSDDCYMNLHNNINYKDCSLVGYTNSLSRHKSCVWDFSISDWMNTEASVDAAGEVVISIYVKPKNGKKYTKTRPHECLPLYRLTYESLNEKSNTIVEKKDNEKSTKNSINFLIDQNAPLKSTLNDMVESYGLVFNDVDLSLYSKVPSCEFARLKNPETMNYPRLGDYPLVSLNKVQWNPNKSSYNWIFTAGESGLARVSLVEFLKDSLFSITS